jgi:Zn-dependent M28 family amino/carboxypeptidase
MRPEGHRKDPPAGRRKRCALVLLAAVAALAGCSHDKKPTPPVGWSLRSAATAHLRALARIGTGNRNTRAAGTPGYAASVDYVADRLRDAGYTIRLQSVPFPHFRETAPPRLQAGGRRLPVATIRYSGSGSVTAAVARVGDGCSAGALRGARGRIALATRGRCFFRDKARLAQAAGARAVVIADPTSKLPLSATLIRPGLRIPAVTAGADALRVRGKATLVVDAVSNESKTQNVIAELPGRARRVVMAGAHLDSVSEGPGINDNGSGVAVTLALAERLRDTPGYRFAFWGAEELGLYGSRHYVASLDPAERRRITGYVNLDMLGSPNPVRYIYGSGPVREALERALKERKLSYQGIDIGASSDHAPFAAAGISAAGLYSGSDERKTASQARVYGGKAGRPLDSCYHQRCDVLQRVDRDVMSELGEAAGQALRELGR